MYSNVQVLDATAQKVYCARVVLVRDSRLSSKAYGWHPLETSQLARLRKCIIWIQNIAQKCHFKIFESAQLRKKKLTKGQIIHFKKFALSNYVDLRMLSLFALCCLISDALLRNSDNNSCSLRSFLTTLVQGFARNEGSGGFLACDWLTRKKLAADWLEGLTPPQVFPNLGLDFKKSALKIELWQ